MDTKMDTKTVAAALASAAHATAAWAGPRVATALIREALGVLSDEELEAELRHAAGLPSAVAAALAQDRRELTAALTGE